MLRLLLCFLGFAHCDVFLVFSFLRRPTSKWLLWSSLFGRLDDTTTYSTRRVEGTTELVFCRCCRWFYYLRLYFHGINSIVKWTPSWLLHCWAGKATSETCIRPQLTRPLCNPKTQPPVSKKARQQHTIIPTANKKLFEDIEVTYLNWSLSCNSATKVSYE